MPHLKTGQKIRVRRQGSEEWVDGLVTLASGNGRSLILSVDGIRVRGIMIGGLPLLWDPETDQYTGLIQPDMFEVEVTA